MSKRITLYGYWRSSAAYRVRICMNLKGLEYDSKSVHLVRNGGEQHSAEYHGLNASELVPVLVDGELQLNQSLAIIQYLEENYPDISVIPQQSPLRYQAVAMAHDIAMEIHPLNNLRVLQYLEGELACDQESKVAWIHHWINKGFASLEEKLENHRKVNGACRFSLSDTPSIVDICLVPQVYNALRFGVDLTPYPVINSIAEACYELPAFIDAMPEHQPDAKS